MGVLEGISVISAKVRGYSKLSLIENYHDTEGPVTFRFHATDELFKGREVAMLLDQLWDMTNRFGKGEVYGCLVKMDDIIAYFKIILQK